ncbi:MAG: hypothetical protein KAV00_06505 [Phycisphaerae bacterium]|nr:hypothetical protein [Phycisphaerae bacterium]
MRIKLIIVMWMYEGEPVAGKEFFDLLKGDQEFCAQLGRTVLAAGRLETELKVFLDAQSVPLKSKRLTLGQLVNLLKEHELLRQMQPSLEMLRDQRNYLVHSLFDLFAGLIEETLLPRADLLDSDVHTYTEKAWLLEGDLNDLADIVAKQRNAYNKSL